MAKIQASKAKNKFAGFFNKTSDVFTGFFDNDSFMNYDFRFNQKEIKEMADYLRDERNKLKHNSRSRLNIFLKEELIKNVESDRFDGKNISKVNEKRLSKEIINTSARWKKLDIENPDEIDTKKKVEIITNNFQAILLKQLSDIDKKMGDEEKKRANKKIDEQLEKMSEERREAIKDALNIEELSGEVLRKAILSSSGPLATIGIVSLSGFGAYIALTTVMHAIFTTALGVTLPFGVYTAATSGLAILAGPIGWLLVVGFGGRQLLKGKKRLSRILLTQAVWFSYNYMEYDVDEDDMPDWVPDRMKDKIKELDEKKDNLFEEISDLKTKKEEIEKELEVTSNLKDKYKKERENIKLKIQTKENKINDLTNKLEDIKAEKEEAVSTILNKEEELSKKEEAINELDKAATESILDLEEQVTNLKNEKVKLQYKLEKKEDMIEEIDENSKELTEDKDSADYKINKQLKNILEMFDIFSYTKKALERIKNLNPVQLNAFLKKLYKVTRLHFSDNSVKFKRKVKGVKGKILEMEFGSDGRIYLLRKGNKYKVCIVGDKGTQNGDINWLKRNH